MKSLKILILTFAVGLTVSSCCSPCRKAREAHMESFMGIEWKLVQWDSEAVPATGMDTYTVMFTADGKITGFGDCNRFSGSYTVTTSGKAHKLSVGQLASTRMGCPDLAKENRFLDALRSVQNFSMDGDILVLTSPGQLVFEKK